MISDSDVEVVYVCVTQRASKARSKLLAGTRELGQAQAGGP